MVRKLSDISPAFEQSDKELVKLHDYIGTPLMMHYWDIRKSEDYGDMAIVKFSIPPDNEILTGISFSGIIHDQLREHVPNDELPALFAVYKQKNYYTLGDPPQQTETDESVPF